ncbi:MAG: Hpt domain-containing protein [Clostridiales bacterium]|nr:Hpt domain-containing protein [Clostridiales bacterium]
MDITKLNGAGISYDEGLRRFANKPELYQKYLVKFFDDPTFRDLGACLVSGRYEEAFRCAHTLKGMTGNLSMTDFYCGICKLVEVLRSRQTEGVDTMYRELVALYDRAKEAVL